MNNFKIIEQVSAKKKKRIFLKYLIIACIVSASNVLFCFNQMVSYAIIAAEVAFLIFILCTKTLTEYISYFMIFICNCIEFAVFTGEDIFYSFKNFRILGINLGIFMLLPVFVIGMVNISAPKVKLNIRKFSFVRGLVGINIIAFFVGLLLVLVNDNNINSLGNIASKYFDEAYTMMFLPLAFIVAFSVIKRKYSHKMYKIGLALQATLWATTFQLLISLFRGLTGAYGYLATLQGSILNFFIPLLIIYRFFEGEVIFPKMTTVVGLIGSILAISYNANGKVIMLFFICIMIYWWFSIRQGSAFQRIVTFAVIFVAISALPFVITYLRENALFNAKFSEVERLINIFSENWIDNLNMSARVRVEEIRDVIIEYGKKPWLIITGKGYLGSILDHTGYFASHIFKPDGFVSEAEFTNRIYYSLHEGARYMIMYGGVGLIFMIRFIADAVKRLMKNANAPLIIGAYWFILFYGYSFTLSTFGIISLLYSYNTGNDDRMAVRRSSTVRFKISAD